MRSKKANKRKAGRATPPEGARPLRAPKTSQGPSRGGRRGSGPSSKQELTESRAKLAEPNARNARTPIVRQEDRTIAGTAIRERPRAARRPRHVEPDSGVCFDARPVSKRKVLSSLTRSELMDIGRGFELAPSPRAEVPELLDLLCTSPRTTLERILPGLGERRLREILKALGLDDRKAGVQALVDRLLVAAEPEAPDPEAPASPAPELELTLAVDPRKPRLAWHGMDRREAAVSVPTQVVEIVRPGRARDLGDTLLNTDVRRASSRASEPAGDGLPPNRLIWTNDNLVALETLLEERDPVTRAHLYRGKVDLVYIDPPFMVNSDFLADNAIDIEIDEEEGVQAKKEPSLVEILAYKDTWRQGLDSFLSMLRARLVLLKDLLAPTGNIYVHLDWHAVHYVKVLMDEVFGYENFQNEIIWKRTSARSDADGFNHIHDAILAYGNAPKPFWAPVYTPLDVDYVRSKYGNIDSRTGKRYRLDNLTSPNPRPNMMYEYDGHPSPENGWRFSLEKMKEMDAAGLIVRPTGRGKRLQFKRFLDDDGMPVTTVWTDISPVNSQAVERLGYPTQKPVPLAERIILASCPPGGLVLDCFLGSGTTAEAAERLGRRWVGIDNGKYAVHLARKRLIHLHDQPRPHEKPQTDYVECATCGNFERKERAGRSPGLFQVRPFTVENMGVYQRAEEWQDFQTQRTKYRDEMIRVFGGEPGTHSPLLHGRRANAWVHVGPLDGPVSSAQVWSIAREAQRTDQRTVEVLSADFDTLSASEKDEIQRVTGVKVTIRIIPASAIDEVRRRLEILRAGGTAPIESMAVPAFYAPLSIVLAKEVRGRNVKVKLERCEIDITSFVRSQRPVLKPITPGMKDAARKKAKTETDKWDARQKELERWLEKATTWQKFVDFWAVDWDYGRRVGADGKPIFETAWQSFRVRKGKGEVEPLTFTAAFQYESAGQYRVAARVTDVFGNDGIATVAAEVK